MAKQESIFIFFCFIDISLFREEIRIFINKNKPGDEHISKNQSKDNENLNNQENEITLRAISFLSDTSRISSQFRQNFLLHKTNTW